MQDAVNTRGIWSGRLEWNLDREVGETWTAQLPLCLQALGAICLFHAGRMKQFPKHAALGGLERRSCEGYREIPAGVEGKGTPIGS